MLLQEWLLVVLITGSVTALNSVPQHATEESLRSALDAITRKQRSLDTNSQDYYNDLRSYKYHGGDGERKFDRERQNERELEEEDEEIEFLPNEIGQLETVGNGFQDLNNKLLERALIDYLENIPQQEEPVTSLFRERERNSGHKRDFGSEQLNIDNKDLTKLFSEESPDGSSYNLGDAEDEGYMDARQILYDRYRGEQGNKIYENSGPMSWGALLNKDSMVRRQGRESEENEFSGREQDPNLLYLSMAERRNLNGGYPAGRSLRTYKNMAKRYLIAKRSPKPVSNKNQITDPKVAQDLGALFGTELADNQNHTHNYKHNHNHDHDYVQNHDINHEHDYGDQHKHDNSSEAPKVTPPPKGQKENITKLDKSRSIEVRKKSVDWSQYFGIDRRRKKATFMAGQGTQNQDNEWMLQRYYDNLVDNLKENDRDYEREANEEKDKLDQLDSKLRNLKDLIIGDILIYENTKDGIDLQKIKDRIMARVALKCTFEKMKEAEKTTHAQNNQTPEFCCNIICKIYLQ
ncbi:PREDICTED: uncharacterized protein LOC108551328 [Eufriesea mexicana]|uniref:uncharacterized protein LOC108551328 n=1 Tax=Eufriesea mexicana TaxID=516756 RepID=UPI00083BBECB|nr:PREDICTED: uncharacterized protein LOC108551328 [Eufriesea mexicana]